MVRVSEHVHTKKKKDPPPPPPPPPQITLFLWLTDRPPQPTTHSKKKQIKKTVFLAWKQPHRCFSPPRCAPSLKMTTNAIIPIVSNAAALSSSIFFKGRRRRRGSRFESKTRRRPRRSVEDIYDMLGETYFRRAFRLSYGSFLELHRRLSNAVSAASR